MTRPHNEHLLWLGTIQRAKYPPPVTRPSMILPKINSLTGKEMNPPDIHTEMNRSYAEYSEKYWAGVEERKVRYRFRRR
jgi:hypothetical protein